MPKFAFQRLLPAILAAGSLFAASSLKAQNNYDVLARVLQPYGALFYSKATTKAMQADVILREGPPTATEILNQPLRVFLQMPDKLRIETLDPQHRVVFCRNGQKVWVYPHEILAGIVVAGRPDGQRREFLIFICLSKINRSFGSLLCFRFCDLNPDQMPTGAPTWNLDFQLAPEFAQAMKCDPWTASAIVRQSDYQVRHLRVESSNWTGSLDILGSRFERTFPPQTWEPDCRVGKRADSRTTGTL